MASSKDLEAKRDRLRQVLNAVVSREEFDRHEIMSLCQENKSIFVSNVLKQLSAEHLLGIVKSDGPRAAPRFAWIIDRNQFDAEQWIAERLNGGNQVQQAPKEERPRERLLEHGAAALKNGELLAILIRSGLRGESAVQAGQRLSKHFEHRLHELPDYAPSELKKISKAVSEVAFCQIMAGVELGRRVAEACAESRPKERINSTKAAIAYCARHFARLAHDARQEEFHIVTLDTKLQPIQSHRITVGTLDASLVHPREVFKAAIRDSASSILLVHNHPSGDPTPSRQDHEVTDRLKSAGELLGIRVIDHVIVASEETVSLAEYA
ncbi:MAG: DNA repair protein RadC [bacterium]|nr:DNA repair protein RadC [bacterium]